MLILIVMVNSTENRNVIRFLDEWYQYSYVPLVGLIMSFLLNFVSLYLHFGHSFCPSRKHIHRWQIKIIIRLNKYISGGICTY